MLHPGGRHGARRPRPRIAAAAARSYADRGWPIMATTAQAPLQSAKLDARRPGRTRQPGPRPLDGHAVDQYPAAYRGAAPVPARRIRNDGGGAHPRAYRSGQPADFQAAARARELFPRGRASRRGRHEAAVDAAIAAPGRSERRGPTPGCSASRRSGISTSSCSASASRGMPTGC